jgi:hypothetical protein
MNETVIFIVGAVIFAITIYGAVIAGGIALTRRELDGDEELRKDVDPDVLESPLALDIEY